MGDNWQSTGVSRTEWGATVVRYPEHLMSQLCADANILTVHLYVHGCMHTYRHTDICTYIQTYSRYIQERLLNRMYIYSIRTYIHTYVCCVYHVCILCINNLSCNTAQGTCKGKGEKAVWQVSLNPHLPSEL